MIVPIAKIKAIPEAQPRVEIREALVAEYAEDLQGGAEFKPVVVFSDDGATFWLADGFHRLEAYKRIGATHIPVDERTGGRRDAILFSVGANAAHGLRRTNADKHRAVETLFRDEEWSKKSDRWIAEKAVVAPDTVGRLRRQLSDSDSCLEPKREGRDGKTRALPQKREPKAQPPEADRGGAVGPLASPASRDDHALDDVGSAMRQAPRQARDPEPPSTSSHKPDTGYRTAASRDTAKVILDAVRNARGAFNDADWRRLLDDLDKVIAVRETNYAAG